MLKNTFNSHANSCDFRAPCVGLLRLRRVRLVVGMLVAIVAASAGSNVSAELAVGDLAPDFSLQGSDGQTYSLSQFRGQQAVVLAWFPRAFTSGCTVECRSLAANGDQIRAFDVTYFMASTDPIEKNVEFADETEADFPLLSDPDGEVAKAYGVFSQGFARRNTFYIGVDGRISLIDQNVKPSTSAEDMVVNLAGLGVAQRESD